MSLRKPLSVLPCASATLLLPHSSLLHLRPATGQREEIPHGGAHLFAAGLGGRFDARVAWTPDGKGLSYFETKGSGKKPRPNSGDDAASGERRLLVSSDKPNRFSCGTLEAHASDGSWAPRAISISMGARWRGYSVSGPHGTCMAGCESQTERTLVSGKARSRTQDVPDAKCKLCPRPQRMACQPC